MFRVIPLLLVTLAGFLVVGTCAVFLMADWQALSGAFTRLEAAVAAQRDLRAITIAQGFDHIYRINCFADGVGVLLGAILAAISALGLDTYGSRSLPVGGVAIALACDKVIEKAKLIAAHQLECAAEDLQFVGGTFSVKGSPDRALPLAAIAFGAFTAHNLPEGCEPNLEAQVSYDPPNFSWPFGTHMCVVEVDTETGAVKILKYIAVDDCGNQINPLIVEGQVHGGVVQGIAQALFEEAVYDSDGNLKTSTLAEYLVPAASDVPAITTGHTITPSPTNQLGVKGIGEAGTIGAAPTVMTAIIDALSSLGVTSMAMPASPQTVWKTIQEATRGGKK